ncbi:MAG: ABC transporter permease [Streptomycetaceae bacterium]|nr:ABC transporter permease [Streptomycetaceae bacterium]
MSLVQTEESLGLTEPGVQSPGEVAAARKGKKKRAGLLWWFAIFWLGIVVLAVIFADFLPAEYDKPIGDAHQAPFESWPEFLGTDYLGRSTLSRIAAGAQTSLIVSTIPVATGILIGGLLGLTAAYFRGAAETVIDIVADALLAFPPLLLLLMLASVLKPPSVWTIAQSKREYVVVAKAMGARPGRIMFKELMPNTVATILSYAVIVMAIMIVAEGSLSFLGVGVPDPEPSWGGMVYKEKDNLETYPGQVFVPCGVLFLTVFSLNVIGDRLRAKFDVRDSNL